MPTTLLRYILICCCAAFLIYHLLISTTVFGKFQVLHSTNETNATIADGNATSEELPLLPSFINYWANYFVLPNQNLTACIIAKSMSQLTTNVMCYLYDSEAFLKNNQSFADVPQLVSTSCGRDYIFRTFEADQKLDAFMRRIVFIRDPFDRFISFYLNKCEHEKHCWNCNADMRCVARTAYEKLSAIANSDVLPVPTYEEFHAAPMSWNCEFHRDLDKFEKVLIGPTIEERAPAIAKFVDVLKQQNVSDDKIEFIKKNALASETIHGTYKSPVRRQAEEQVKNDPIVRKYLHLMYLKDYEIFKLDRTPLDLKYR
ncbi:unnamed protein product [Caenorhabditis bovis]|uniref:Sulfotransferase domain-containing protein n=1 Tax=Caenorhabditis bovis TaxID=2654633 RepID=A0A8S1ES90_9PELO|nr:unnamed protein product [Caenorhabditis bovis]